MSANPSTVKDGAVLGRRAQAAIPPMKGAPKWQKVHPRDVVVDACSPGPASRACWKRESGYRRRSLAETAMYRFKQVLCERLRSRTFETQQVEAHVGGAALSRLTMLGMPVRLCRSREPPNKPLRGWGED